MSKSKKHDKSDFAKPVTVKINGRRRKFDIDDTKLPAWLKNGMMGSGGYPYDERMDRKDYEAQLEQLQIELVKMQAWLKETGERILIIFEGRDAAGKGGTIAALRDYLNPRTARNVALPKPTETERGQWYYQRYATHFPTRGEIVTFDRSWYNRGGVEPVMGFCTEEEYDRFLIETPKLEQMIVDDGIHFFKFWLNIGQLMQLKRFHDRRHSLLKQWKFSPIDIDGMTKWDQYTEFRDRTIHHTHTDQAPWIIVRANDKRRARLECIRKILLSLDYEGREIDTIGSHDPQIIGTGPDFLDED